MRSTNRKVCISGPVRLPLAPELLKEAGCEVVLGKSIDDFPGQRYTNAEMVKLIGDSPVLIVATREVMNRQIMASCDKLQAVIKSSIGVENIDVKAATELGILVCNSPAPENFTGLAEATIGLMVALFKGLKRNEALLRSGGWKQTEDRGALMAGKTIGIVGLGRVGREVARRLGPWDVHLVGCDPYVSSPDAAAVGVKLVPFNEVLRASDLVTIHVVLTPETRHMITLRELKTMKPTAYLINTSRGAALREEDLVVALKEGMIAGAAIDVFEEEPLPMTSALRGVDPARLILTPHIIGTNPQSLETGLRMAVQSALEILEGRVPQTVLNRAAVPRWRERFRS